MTVPACSSRRRLMDASAGTDRRLRMISPSSWTILASIEESMLSYDGEAMRLIILAAVFISMAGAQQYDLVLCGGRVIDPGNGIDGRMDVAGSNGRIAAVQPEIPAAMARK